MHVTCNAKVMFLRSLQIARTVSGKRNPHSVTNPGFRLRGVWVPLMFFLSPRYMKLQALCLGGKSRESGARLPGFTFRLLFYELSVLGQDS